MIASFRPMEMHQYRRESAPPNAQWGIIFMIGQLLFDIMKLTPAHTISARSIRSILDGFGLYERTGAGATVPIQICECTRSWRFG